MATAGELTIVLEAQDRASAQIRELGQDVQRLERQVESAARSTSAMGRVFSGIGSGLRAGLGFAAAEVGLRGIQEALGFVGESVVGMNSALEQATATFRTFTGSASEARAIVADLSRNADVTPFDTREVIAAGQALVSSARGSREALMELIETAEQLAAYRPTEGLEGATFALREALEGDLQSIRERFGLSAQSIRQFQAQGMTALQAVRAEMERVGATSRLVQELSQTFGGLASNITSAFAEVRRRLGEGLFDRLSDGLRALSNALNRNRDALYEWASRMGAIIGEVAARVGGILGNLAVQLLNWIDPGAGDRLRELFSGVAATVADVEAAASQAAPAVQTLSRALTLPEARDALRRASGDLEQLQTLAAQTARPVEQLARDLGAAGLAAAELQFQADRVRDAYQRQLDPLERQLRALQNSVDLQRVQNGLASNRGAQERLRLEQEIAALQEAAAGREDPAAPGLNARQRMIALALQERRLRLEELGLEEQRRPLVQELQARIEALNEEQQRALAPIQAQIAAHRERIDLLQLERQRWELLRGEIQTTIDAVNATPLQPRPEAPEPAEVNRVKDELRRVGEDFGNSLQRGWDAWLAKGEGDLWKAIGAHLQQWYDTEGKPLAQRIGTDLGTTLGAAVGTALPDALWKALGERMTAAATTSAGTDAIKEALRRIFTEHLRTGEGAPEPAAPPPLPTPRPLPTVGAGRDTGGAPPLGPLPLVRPEVGPAPAPPPVNVNVNVDELRLAEEGRQARIDALTESLGREVATAVVDSLIAAEQQTDAGPGRLLQGGPR